MSDRTIEMVVPGDGAHGDRGRGDGREVESRRGGFAGSTRGRRGRSLGKADGNQHRNWKRPRAATMQSVFYPADRSMFLYPRQAGGGREATEARPTLPLRL